MATVNIHPASEKLTQAPDETQALSTSAATFSSCGVWSLSRHCSVSPGPAVEAVFNTEQRELTDTRGRKQNNLQFVSFIHSFIHAARWGLIKPLTPKNASLCQARMLTDGTELAPENNKLTVQLAKRHTAVTAGGTDAQHRLTKTSGLTTHVRRYLSARVLRYE